MALSNNRVHRGGETPYTWERQALDFVYAGLPDVDPYQAWELHELLEGPTGGLYEIDLLLLGRHALYLVEIKSWPGRVTGDTRDWKVYHDGRVRLVENPYRLTNTKAKKLATLLDRELGNDRVYVQPLVFLSHEDIELRLPDAARSHVVTRRDVIRAFTHGEATGDDRRPVVNRPRMRAVAQALDKLEFRESVAARRVGQYHLGALLAEGAGWQEHRGRNVDLEQRTCRVRSYLAPRASSEPREAQLRRAARREADVLTRLGRHPGILACEDYVERAPLGPALLFEDPSDALSLDRFLRAEPDLSFDERIAVIESIAEALHFCHHKGFLHRNLSPAAVLVRRGDDGRLDVRVHSFQLAAEQEGSLGTSHLTALADDLDLLYAAPEVLDDPSQAGPEGDVFSLGAVARFVLTGQHPADSLEARDTVLLRDGALGVAGLRDDLYAGIDDAIRFATQFHSVHRADDAMAWFAMLEEAATAPDPGEERVEVDPQEARVGDVLAGALRVLGILGKGTTARVLHVEGGRGDDAREYALKVPHHEGAALRLAEEAAVLAHLDVQNVVRSHGLRRIGERDCLLLDFAGKETLAARIRAEGSIGLDLAKRYGEDLLFAIQHLEESGYPHRDIKPGNIGFTQRAKKAQHLLLFDFSVASLPATEIRAGTPAYRDPFLRERGRWDAAADRWSAAVTLHEMLTGVRPTVTVEDDGGGRTVHIAAERFDAALRDRMSAFFARCFAPDVADRFPSAEVMRTEWVSLFVALAAVAEVTPENGKGRRREDDGGTASDGSADGLPGDLTLDTSVDALPLSTRARNALDRAAVLTVRELVGLPRNRLSAIRGVGRKVSQEIHALAERLRVRFSDAAAPVPDPFAPEYGGRRFALIPEDELGLTADEVRLLGDAGVATTTDLAASSRARVERILGSDRAAAVHEALVAPDTTAERPTLDDWVARLLAPRKKRPARWENRVRTLVGLDPLPGAAPPAPSSGDTPFDFLRLDVAAEALGITRQALHIALQKARAEWNLRPALPGLVDAVRVALRALGGLASLDELAAALAEAHGRAASTGAERLRQAVALLRLVVELRPDDAAPPVVFARIGGGVWLALEGETLTVARRLARLADELAAGMPLPSSETVRQQTAALVADTPLAPLPDDRRVALAARLSSGAACSGRLELYPRGMPADRALELSVSALALPELRPAEVRRRVAARYPEAEPLPGRPALDDLLAPYELAYVESEGVYRRRGQTLPSTSMASLVPTILPRLGTHEPAPESPGAREAREFHERLLAAKETGRFRVVQVGAHVAEKAAEFIGRVLGVPPVSLDALLLEAIAAERDRLGVREDVVLAADRRGAAAGVGWDRLRRLAAGAADRVVARILADRRSRPLLLVHPGAFARYGLADAFQELVEAAQRDDGEAVVLVVPTYGDGGAPAVNGTLPVPAPLPSQRLRAPLSWVEDEHRML